MAHTNQHTDPAYLNGWIREFNEHRSSDRIQFLSDTPRRNFYASSIMSESRTVPRSHASWATSASSCEEVFDKEYAGTFYSMSTAPSTNGPERQHRDLPIPAPAVPPSRLFCEFVGYDNCDVTFEIDDEEAWIDHIAYYHLNYIFPARCICWFCDNTEYRAASNTTADLESCYRQRMHHIAGHSNSTMQGTTMSYRKLKISILPAGDPQPRNEA
ncbi:hypothetical protein QQZ08_008707 [Neonectria magnoliae]|uniref:Uncharacterized protein n=1 Tax=Neonectria magnoliae TaxID=2732573 RepID=A0ABR1HTS6_9HYPO